MYIKRGRETAWELLFSSNEHMIHKKIVTVFNLKYIYIYIFQLFTYFYVRSIFHSLSCKKLQVALLVLSCSQRKRKMWLLNWTELSTLTSSSSTFVLCTLHSLVKDGMRIRGKLDHVYLPRKKMWGRGEASLTAKHCSMLWLLFSLTGG